MRSIIRLFIVFCLLVMASSVHGSALSPFKGNPSSPPLKLSDLTGQMHDLLNYSDKVVLINFWATWCPPCVKELPSLQRLQSHYQGQKFAVLTVDVGEDKATIDQFLNSIDPVQLTVLLDQEAKAHNDWKVYVFPTSFLIDRNGAIRYGAVGALEWDDPAVTSIIDKLLSEEE
ncbi:MAG: TlpA family protein disulfide reductase [Gammaproteobacteria bacterium]|nr:MAG: TlpA family protein disulfide reductase [Gammaproteobacteria bacterium]